MPLYGLNRRKISLAIPVIIILFLYCFILPRGEQRPSSRYGRSRHKIQHNFGSNPSSLAQPDRLHAVRREFVHAWTAYSDHGWMSDSLGPLTGQHENQFCGWSATLIDALDTMWIMDLLEEFDYAVDALQDIKFDNPNNTCNVNVFETVIRHLGGLLSAYDLSNDPRILPKLVEIGDVLHRSFSTQNGMPCSYCPLMSEDPPFKTPNNVAMAVQGSLYLEFARLSQITNNPRYMYSVMKLTEVFAKTQNDSSIPGMWPELIGYFLPLQCVSDWHSIPQAHACVESILNPFSNYPSTSSNRNIDPSNVAGDSAERQFAKVGVSYTLGALSDSSYEYLVKSHLLLGKLTTRYKDMWKLAATQIRKYLLFRAQVPGSSKSDLLFTGKATRRSSDPIEIDHEQTHQVTFEAHVEHLGCFAGGMFALASRIFDEPDDFLIGQALTSGCVWAYQNSPLGIMPEAMTLLVCDNDNGTQCEENPEVWEGHMGDQVGSERSLNLPAGIVNVVDSKYLLRPEAIESVFIMWRLTGDPYWRDVGWEMFRNIREHTWSPYGHASLDNVMAPRFPDEYGNLERPTQRDQMESFWFGETLKYFYLLFSSPDVIDLDDFVLNTEAHPLRLTDGSRGF